MAFELKPILDVQELIQFLGKCFPENEIRSAKDLEKLYQNPAYQTWCYRQNKNISAVLTGFVFDEYVFFEFLAVDDHLRGQGIGKKILSSVMKELGKPVILEVEPPCDPISQRRVHFYQRLGFHLCEEFYRMPRLDDKHGGYEFKLMSYPESLSSEQFHQRVKHIYKYVYEKAL